MKGGGGGRHGRGGRGGLCGGEERGIVRRDGG